MPHKKKYHYVTYSSLALYICINKMGNEGKMGNTKDRSKQTHPRDPMDISFMLIVQWSCICCAASPRFNPGHCYIGSGPYVDQCSDSGKDSIQFSNFLKSK